MKQKILNIFILILISYFSVNGQVSSWKLIDQDWIYKGTAHYQLNYVGIKCYDSLNCIAVGNFGMEYPWNRVSTDGGKTWNTTLADTAISYIDSLGHAHLLYQPAKAGAVVYKDSSLCIIVCDSGYFYRSTDRCQTWSKGKVYKRAIFPTIDMYDTKFGSMTSGLIYITTNGGIIWNTPNLNLPDSLMPMGYEDISVPDSNRIIVLVWRSDINEYLIESNDNGKTWNYLNNLLNKRSQKIYFFNNKIGWILSGTQIKSSTYTQTILHTEDGGRNWVIQLDTFARPWTLLSSVSFADSLNGVAIGDFWNLWKTSDGGQHWIQDTVFYKDSIFTNQTLTCIAYPTKSKIFAGSEDGIIYEYSDEIVGVEDNWDNNTELKDGTSLVYPNPSKGEIIIKYNSINTGNLKLEIYDEFGDLILSKSFKKDDMEISVPVSLKDIGQGVFYFKIKNESNILNYGVFSIIR